MKSIGRRLQKDWKELLADCFPKILVNILPYFVLRGQDPLVAQQREKANRVYELLKDSSYLGKQVSARRTPHPSSFTLKRPNQNCCCLNVVKSERGAAPVKMGSAQTSPLTIAEGSEVVEVDSEEMKRGQLGAVRFTEASTIHHHTVTP